jgi:hypothetical protein
VRLELSDRSAIDNPSSDQVERALRRLGAAGDGYAILASDPDSYLQTSVAGEGGFLLEFQQGSTDQHYRASRTVSLDQTLRAFRSYLSQDGRWRTALDWQRLHLAAADQTPSARRGPRRINPGRALARFGVDVIWALVQLIVLAALFVAGGELGGALGFLVMPRIFGLPLALGFAAGVVAGLVVNHSSRMWIMRLRLRRLRRSGQRVDATVLHVEEGYASGGRGGGMTTYTVYVGWRDRDGAEHEYERRYRFWGRRSRAFEAAVVGQPALPVFYAPGHPSRFVIDIPFAPTMADLALGEGKGQIHVQNA